MPITRKLDSCFAACLLAAMLTLPSPADPQRARDSTQPAPAVTAPQLQAPAVSEPALMPAPLPERTNAVFGDWSVTCTQTSRNTRQCEAASAVQDQSRQAAVLAFGRTAKTEPLRVVVQVPVNIRIASPVKLVIDAGPVVSVPFTSCNRLGCFADVAAVDDLVSRLRVRPVDSTSGRIEWHDSADSVITLPLSTKGFAAAWDNLQSEEKR